MNHDDLIARLREGSMRRTECHEAAGAIEAMRDERDALRETDERDALREANERFNKRQEWWTETMFALEQERDALKASELEASARCREYETIIASLSLDAERYRYLIENCVRENEGGDKSINFLCDFEHYDDPRGSIEEAMQEKQS